MDKILSRLNGKKILILGFAREGRSTLAFLKKWVKNAVIGIADKSEVKVSDENLATHFGEKYLESIFEYDVVFKAPGIANKLPQIKKAKENGIVVTSQTKLFFDLCRGEIVGVTGTKGKSTTASLIFNILDKAKKDCVILGNIGKPCLDYFDDNFGEGKYYVYEMSSHQLADLTRSPHVAVFLNIYREHLDYYGDFEDYFRAKANITKFQSDKDFFVYNASFEKIADLAGETRAKKLPFSLDKKSIFELEKVIPISGIPLKGEHNLNNVMAAVLAARALGVADGPIGRAVMEFKPLEHRLQEIARRGGITFVDDTLATIPEATIAAIKSLSGKVGTIILGGADRGQDFGKLAKVVVEERIGNVILFPPTGQRIWAEIEKNPAGSLPRQVFADNMEAAVAAAYKFTPKGKICLLSSAAPSFGIFKNYEDKAGQFKKYVLRGENF